jgi:hypothetical protein
MECRVVDRTATLTPYASVVADSAMSAFLHRRLPCSAHSRLRPGADRLRSYDGDKTSTPLFTGESVALGDRQEFTRRSAPR